LQHALPRPPRAHIAAIIMVTSCWRLKAAMCAAAKRQASASGVGEHQAWAWREIAKGVA